MALNGIRAVFFDLDGTLIDSAPDISSALNRVLASEELPEQPVDRVLRWIGRGPEKLIDAALVHVEGLAPEPERVARVMRSYLDEYQANPCRATRLYENAREVLDVLRARGIALACITNKMEKLTVTVLEALKLHQYFPVALCADSMQQRKPAPQPLLRAAELVGQPIQSCVMVGDSVTDVKAARAAGCSVVAVSWGYNHGEDIREARADAVIDSLPELLPLIR